MNACGTLFCFSSPPVHGKSLPASLISSRSRHQKHCQATLHSDSAGFGQPPLVSDTVKQLADKVRRKPGSAKPTLRQHNPGRQLSTSRPHNGSTLADSQLLKFEREGHITFRALLPQNEVLQLEQVVRQEVESRELEALKHRVRVLCPDSRPDQLLTTQAALVELERKGTEPIGFLQTFNTWRSNQRIRCFVTSGCLASTAASLLGSKAVRLYQDCAFLKKPGFHVTNWHSDLRMTPLDTNDFVTAWIPLRRIQGSGDSCLSFASRSHRDFALPFWRHAGLKDMDLSTRGYKITSTGVMELGDVSWHHGWTLHCAAPQPVWSEPRLALSVSYFRDGAQLVPNRIAASRMPSEDRESYSVWLNDLRDGMAARHALLPLVLL